MKPDQERLSEQAREEQCAANTDRELWREGGGDGNGMSYYEPSIHVTEQGRIGINVGGHVYVKTLREWHSLARQLTEAERERDELRDTFTFDTVRQRYREALELVENMTAAVPPKGATQHYIQAINEEARRALDTGEAQASPPKSSSGAALNPGGSEDLGPIQEPIMHERARRSWLRSQAKRAAENRAGGSEESG